MIGKSYKRWGLPGGILAVVFVALWKLIEDAVIGWINSQIAEVLNMPDFSLQQAYPNLTTYLPLVFLVAVAFFVVRWAYKRGSAGVSKSDTEKVFIKAPGSSGLRLIGNFFRGDRTHVDAPDAKDLQAVGNIHAEVKSEQKSIDNEIIQLRSDVKRLVRTLLDFGSPEDQRQDVIDRMNRIHASDHAVWLTDELSQARVDFLHWCGIARYVREKHGPTFRTFMEREETLFLINDAASRIEAGLTGKPIPAPADPLKLKQGGESISVATSTSKDRTS